MKNQNVSPKNFYWWKADVLSEKTAVKEVKPGEWCPSCARAKLAYNGLFVLICPACSYVAECGAFT